MDTFDRESGRDLPSLPGRAAQPIPQRRTAAMKVAMICDVMGQPNNGTTLAALNLIRYLRDAGHTVTVVAPGGEASDGYLPVRVWHAGPLIDRILRMNGVELAVPDKQLLEAVIREADVVHLLIPLPLARAALKIARRLG